MSVPRYAGSVTGQVRDARRPPRHRSARTVRVAWSEWAVLALAVLVVLVTLAVIGQDLAASLASP